MFMQSNQPFRQDTVLDGALIGAAAGAGAMYGATAAAPKLQDWNNKDMARNKTAYREASAADRQIRSQGMIKAGQESVRQLETQNPNATASEKLKAVNQGQQGFQGEASKARKSAANDLAMNRKVDKVATKLQGGSSRSRAMMYGGSIIAGAIGGAMIDSGN